MNDARSLTPAPRDGSEEEVSRLQAQNRELLRRSEEAEVKASRADRERASAEKRAKEGATGHSTMHCCSAH